MTHLLAGYGVLALLMALLWLWQCRMGRGSIVDVAWALGVAGLAIYQLQAVPEVPTTRHRLVAILIASWALRLGGLLLWRICRLAEDGRYLAMNQKWGGMASWRMFSFYQFQAVGCLLFAWPFLLIALNTSDLGMLDYVGVGLWLVGVLGGGLADMQLTRFRLSESTGGVCQRGLWRYSRHPNYFFEWVHWCSYVLFSWAAPYGWLVILLPATLLVLIFFVTGIPPTERQALASRGDAYRAYQQTTSACFPWPPKPTATEGD